MKDYFVCRENFVGVFLLVDASVSSTENDERYANWFIEYEMLFMIVFMKCD